MEKALTSEKIIILDFGSQYTQLIARRIREAGVYSEILPHETSLKKIKEINASVSYTHLTLPTKRIV